MSPRDWIRKAAIAAFRRVEAWTRETERRELYASFAAFGRHSRIESPIHVFHPELIWIGRNVSIRSYVRLEAVTEYRLGGSAGFTPRLEIGDGTLIQYLAHIGCNRSVIIGRNVGIAAKVYITDHVHLFEDPDVPPTQQPISAGEEVVIEDDVFLGEGVVVLPGVRIGRHSVVGANSVVTRSLPEFSVAAGMPARVIRRYDFESRQWRKVASG